MRMIGVMAGDNPVLLAVDEIILIAVKENAMDKGKHVRIYTKHQGEFCFPRHVDCYDKAIMYIRENAASLISKG